MHVNGAGFLADSLAVQCGVFEKHGYITWAKMKTPEIVDRSLQRKMVRLLHAQ